uniref:E3 SUMO-protein ligase NSE2 n=1 Tax=Timema monikensis TaxID=170555 RepID=A0A7R9HJP8_9NEOP|nr:unnamed protein product [Timema monikensis]
MLTFDDDDIENYIINSMNSIENSAKIIIGTCTDDTIRSNCVKGLSNTMKDYCGLSEEFKNTCKVMREIERQHKDIEKRTYRSKDNEEERENHDENQDEIGEINYCQVFKTKLMAMRKATPGGSKHPKYLEYKKNITALLHQGDREDLLLTEAEQCIIDPFTKQIMINPVKNKQCGHNYEKATVIQIIATKKSRCPVVNCPNKKYIEDADLESNDQLKLYIQRLPSSSQDASQT